MGDIVQDAVAWSRNFQETRQLMIDREQRKVADQVLQQLSVLEEEQSNKVAEAFNVIRGLNQQALEGKEISNTVIRAANSALVMAFTEKVNTMQSHYMRAISAAQDNPHLIQAVSSLSAQNMQMVSQLSATLGETASSVEAEEAQGRELAARERAAARADETERRGQDVSLAQTGMQTGTQLQIANIDAATNRMAIQIDRDRVEMDLGRFKMGMAQEFGPMIKRMHEEGFDYPQIDAWLVQNMPGMPEGVISSEEIVDRYTGVSNDNREELKRVQSALKRMEDSGIPDKDKYATFKRRETVLLEKDDQELRKSIEEEEFVLEHGLAERFGVRMREFMKASKARTLGVLEAPGAAIEGARSIPAPAPRNPAKAAQRAGRGLAGEGY